jgi:hypothetical protein
MMADHDPDRARGLYRKYEVRKVMRSTDQRGEGVETLVPITGDYFVLREADPYAIAAINAYANACSDRYPTLAVELTDMAHRWTLAHLEGPNGEDDK